MAVGSTPCLGLYQPSNRVNENFHIVANKNGTEVESGF